jgi:hypothetical protein
MLRSKRKNPSRTPEHTQQDTHLPISVNLAVALVPSTAVDTYCSRTDAPGLTVETTARKAVAGATWRLAVPPATWRASITPGPPGWGLLVELVILLVLVALVALVSSSDPPTPLQLQNNKTEKQTSGLRCFTQCCSDFPS